MAKLGFSAKWISTIMDYLRTTTLAVLINGNLTDFFRPSRGLRQGCPLSPYLFLLCSQALSALLKRSVQLRGIRGLRCARKAPEITHVFFADDTLLFGQADIVTSNLFREILDLYESASGQSINLLKSCITFSPNTPSLLKTQIFSGLRMNHNESYEVYLGLPSFT